jgi:hexosaminidase
VSRNITIQHWEFFEDNPFDLIKAGYSLLNSDDGFYIVGKWSGSYPQQLNITRIFEGNPAGGAFAPYVFDTNNATNNPPRSDPNVVGHIAAQWNDYGPNATVVSEAYYAWRDALPALADKQWGGVLTRAQYDDVFEALHSVIPGQNLDHAIASKTDVILQYDFATVTGGVVTDSSGNGYDGACHDCSVSHGVVSLTAGSLLTTPLTSKGRNYTLSFSINPSSRALIGAPILSGPDSSLVLGNGTLPSLALISGNQAYALNYTLPRDMWTDVVLIGRGNATFLRAGGAPEMQFLTVLGINGASFEWKPIAVEAPLAQIGGDGFVGSIAKYQLTGSA